MTDTLMMSTVAGIDVGGDRKGCHLVVLHGKSILCSTNKKTPHELVQVCSEYDVTAVGIDSPCQWRAENGARLAERELAREKVSSFSTPTRELALANTANFYGWMFNGERVYQALSLRYPLLTGRAYTGGRICFETFPYAITCALLGREVASAKLKRTQRREILEGLGIDTKVLRSIDAVDAALCALTAQYLLNGAARSFGDALGGYIWVPAAASF